MRKIDMTTFQADPGRYELRRGDVEGAPNCPYVNQYEWIGYDLVSKEYVRFTKSVFKVLVAQEQ